MIDTVRLKVECEVVDDFKFSSITGVKAGKLQFRVFKDSMKIGSFSYDVNLYINTDSELFIEYSLPKLLYGNNIQEANLKDLGTSLEQVRGSINNYISIPPVDEWEFQRIDLCKYIESQNPYSDIFLFQSLDYPRQKKYLYDTSVMFKGGSFSTKFYLKKEEFVKHDYKKLARYDLDLADELFNRSNSLIRVETTYRVKALRNIFRSNVITYPLLVKDFQKVINHFQKVISKLYGDISPEKLTEKKLWEELNARFKPSRAMQIYEFYTFWSLNDFNKKLLEKNYSRRTVYRYKKVISEALKTDL